MIRPLAKQDRDDVIELLRQTGSFTPAELAVADELITIVISQPLQKDYFGFVSLVDASAARCVGMMVTGPTPATEGTWQLYWIAVHPLYQGTGVAQALEQHAEVFVRERGAYWLLAETSSQISYGRARAFYRKQGYVQLARIPEYYKRSDDLLIFGKRLDAVA
jgi:ribosomal protein S18 acetylase RimI-like enzyme